MFKTPWHHHTCDMSSINRRGGETYMDLHIEEMEPLDAPGWKEWASGVLVGVGVGMIAAAIT